MSDSDTTIVVKPLASSTAAEHDQATDDHLGPRGLHARHALTPSRGQCGQAIAQLSDAFGPEHVMVDPRSVVFDETEVDRCEGRDGAREPDQRAR